MPELPLTESGQQSRQKLLTELAGRENLTLAELGRKIAGGRGHYSLVGTPEQIADRLQEWFEQGAADGFNVLVPHLPGGLEDFANGVVPELQRRGLFRTEYEGRTLRQNLGLARPGNQICVTPFASRARSHRENCIHKVVGASLLAEAVDTRFQDRQERIR